MMGPPPAGDAHGHAWHYYAEDGRLLTVGFDPGTQRLSSVRCVQQAGAALSCPDILSVELRGHPHFAMRVARAPSRG